MFGITANSPARYTRTRSIPTLDGWRAIAILLVIFHHAGLEFAASENEYWLHNPTRFGHIGVPIFFGISGLLITKLLLEEIDQSGRFSFRGFYLRRAFRILPPVFLLLFTVAVLGQMKGWLEAVASVLFFRNYLGVENGGWYTGHLWSLAVEEHFYLLWPLLLSILLKSRRPAFAVAFLACSVAIARAVDVSFDLTPRYAPLLLGVRSDLYFDGLLWGCLAGFLLHSQQTRKWLTRALSPSTFTVCCALFLAYLARGYHQGMAHWPTAILIPTMLLSTVTHSDWSISRFLSLPLLRWVGRISYSLYLWQQIFFTPSWVAHWAGTPQRLPWSIALCLACATLSYYFVEKPAIRLGRYLAARIGFSKTSVAEDLTVVGTLSSGGAASL